MNSFNKFAVEGGGETNNVVGKESLHPDAHETFIQVSYGVGNMSGRRRARSPAVYRRASLPDPLSFAC